MHAAAPAASEAGAGSPLVRAAINAGVRVDLVGTIPGSRHLERRLKRWHKTGQFCPLPRRAAAKRAETLRASSTIVSPASERSTRRVRREIARCRHR